MGSNSVITLKKKVIAVIYKITIIALGKFYKNGSQLLLNLVVD